MKRAIEEYFPIIEINRLAVPERNAQLPPETCLTEGEKMVHVVEEMILASVFSLHDEVATAFMNAPRLSALIAEQTPTTIIVFDGTSLREIPMLHHLAAQTP